MEEVRIADMADAEGIVSDHVFEDCNIVGPAVLIAVGDETEFLDCRFPAPPGAFLWEVPTGVRKYGAVLLRRCIFRRCRFGITIGLVTDRERAHAMHSSLN
jgi:hypothetical protein